MARVYVDTSAFYSALVSGDEDHARSRGTLEILREQDARLVASSHVILETVTLLHRRWGAEAVVDWERRVEPLVEIVWIDAETHRRGMSALLASTERRISLTDWCSFEIIRRERIDRAFAFDRHFHGRGFEVIPGT